MVRLSLAVFVRLPEVPVMVIVAVVVAAELLAVRVRVLVVVAAAGLNDAVTPAGNPEAERFTVPLKPCWGLTVMVLAAFDPAAMDTVEADEARLKLGVLDEAVRALMSA